MSDLNDYDDDQDESEIDPEETSTTPASNDDAEKLTDAELAEAESLTVTAKQHIREQLEDELARFLAQGGTITEVPPDDTIDKS